MTCSLLTQDLLKTCSWSAYDLLMTFSWPSHDFLMTFSWLSLDFLMTFSWPCQKLLMTFSWPSHDFLMTFSWPAHDFLMTFSWLLRHFLNVWISHGLCRIDPCFPPLPLSLLNIILCLVDILFSVGYSQNQDDRPPTRSAVTKRLWLLWLKITMMSPFRCCPPAS